MTSSFWPRFRYAWNAMWHKAPLLTLLHPHSALGTAVELAQAPQYGDVSFDSSVLPLYCTLSGIALIVAGGAFIATSSPLGCAVAIYCVSGLIASAHAMERMLPSIYEGLNAPAKPVYTPQQVQAMVHQCAILLTSVGMSVSASNLPYETLSTAECQGIAAKLERILSFDKTRCSTLSETVHHLQHAQAQFNTCISDAESTINSRRFAQQRELRVQQRVQQYLEV